MRKYYRVRNADINPETHFPFDWEQDKQYHGVSRATTVRRYVVRLSAAGKQFTLGTASNQDEAARMYDLANWKLAAFIKKPRFNFSENLTEYTEASVRERAPYLDAFYAECVTLKPLSPDLTEREHREAKFEEMVNNLSPARQPATGSASAYPRLKDAVGKAGAQAFLARNRIVTLRGKLKLIKLPALDADIQALEAKFADLNESASKLFYSLEKHANIYSAMQREDDNNS